MTNAVPLRIPTTQEWEHMMDAVHGDNLITNWKYMYSWTHDAGIVKERPSSRMVRGYSSPRLWNNFDAAAQLTFVGFRPAFDILPSGTPKDSLRDGDIVLAGTLYMDGKPVRIPINPTWDGDIEDYIPSTALTFGPAIDDTDFMVTAIKVGSVFIADQALLKNISYKDIENALA